MKCLYIAEDYLTSSVHHHLAEALAVQGMDMTVFTVERRNKAMKDLRFGYGDIRYKSIVTPLEGSHPAYKYFFPYKIRTKYDMINREIDLSGINIIHAATLFSEGAVALEIYRKHAIPYIVAVRSSDLFFYLRKMPHLWNLGKKILREARRIIFITPNARQMALQSPVLRDMKDYIQTNSVVIPNGMDPFWHTHINRKKPVKTPSSILYVGNFEDCKNVPVLIRSCELLRTDHPDLTLTLAGGGGNRQKEVKIMAEKHPEWITMTGRVTDREVLMEIYRRHDIFAMVSRETFGLVYLEALTQGLPLVYARNSGFDGIFDEGFVGYGAVLGNSRDLASNIRRVMEEYEVLAGNIGTLSFDAYRWENIAERYREIYERS